MSEAELQSERERRERLLREIEAIERDLLADLAPVPVPAGTPVGSIRLRAQQRKAGQNGDDSAAQSAVQPEAGSVPPVSAAAPVPTPTPEPRLQVVAAPQPAPTPEPPPVGAPATAPAPAARGSLLEQLRAQAMDQLQAEKRRKEQAAGSSVRLDKALRDVFAYCHDLAQQLNILHPPVARRYALSPTVRFEDLMWQAGRADYRTDLYEEFAHVRRVTFSWLLIGPNALEVEREGPAMESLRKMLFDHGIPFEQEDFRNALRRVERAKFRINTEIRVGMRWEADQTNGRINLTITNLDRFGMLTYSFVPEIVNAALLDEMGRHILGQPNRFMHLLSQPAPTY